MMDLSGKPRLNLEALLERVLIALPTAEVKDVRRLAPAFRDVPENDLRERMARARQRIATKAGRR